MSNVIEFPKKIYTVEEVIKGLRWEFFPYEDPCLSGEDCILTVITLDPEMNTKIEGAEYRGLIPIRELKRARVELDEFFYKLCGFQSHAVNDFIDKNIIGVQNNEQFLDEQNRFS